MESQTFRLLKICSYFIISLISIFIVIDTDLFVYSSLSNSLIFSLLTFILSIVALIFRIIDKRENDRIYLYEFVFLAWGIYIAMHTFFSGGEYYRSNYLITGLLYTISISYLIRSKIINGRFIKLLLLFIAIVQLLCMSGQLLGVIESGSKYFPITGIGENPNSNAVYLVCCLPFVIERIKLGRYKLFYYLFLSLIIIFLILLKCRTAYVGGLIMLLIYLFSSGSAKSVWMGMSKLKKIILIIGVVIGIWAIGTVFYQVKKDSADGRIFVWKVTMEMIAKKPVIGYGYGLFERNYNIQQAAYFNEEIATQTERQNASHVAMAYNDYLEQIIEGGIVGALFYIGCFVLLLYAAIRQHQKEMYTILFAILLMAFFNFIYTAIIVWYLVLNCAAVLLSESFKYFSVPKKVGYSMFSIIGIGMIGLFYNTCCMTKAQINLKKGISFMKEKKWNDAQSILNSSLHKARTSEAFLIQYANLLMSQGEYKKALYYYKKASLYTSSSRLYFRMSDCYIHLSDNEKALECLKFVASKIPTNLRSRYQILCLQMQMDDRAGVREMALEMINLKPKVINKKSMEYQKRAKMILESME